jgi:NADPH:quinone reductase-like Zn-dependent oxidoreductase
VQLAKRRGARVIAIAGAQKAEAVSSLGADQVIARDQPVLSQIARESVDAVIDVVAGPGWPELLEVLRRAGRYAVSGAIGGPIVSLDVRTLYLKDLSLFGCTMLDKGVFGNLVSYIEQGQIKPLVARTYPLRDIVRAQQEFLAKNHVGKLVLLPPPGE